MYKHDLSVYGEDLLNGSTAGIIRAGGTNLGLVVRVFAKEDGQSVGSTDITIKDGASAAAVTNSVAVVNVASASPVKAGQKLAEVTLPFDVKTFVTASAAAGSDAGTGATASTNLIVTLGYIPR